MQKREKNEREEEKPMWHRPVGISPGGKRVQNSPGLSEGRDLHMFGCWVSPENTDLYPKTWSGAGMFYNSLSFPWSITTDRVCPSSQRKAAAGNSYKNESCL